MTGAGERSPNRVALLGRVPLACLLMAIGCQALVSGARAAPRPEGDLAAALDRLVQERKIELLFDRRLASGKPAPPPRRGSSVEQALKHLLRNSGLTFRRAADGSYLIVRAAPAPTAVQPAVAAADQPEDGHVAEILVIGRHLLNADIRRNVNDTQPYRVVSSSAVIRSQATTVDDYLRSRLSENSQAIALNQAPRLNGGIARSQVDLRGLGTAQTLVLINGRRLPSVPYGGNFLQPDLNGVPLSAIDRIETLASSASGIFGIGAAGGVVNLVTKGDFDAVDIVSRVGISERGDAFQRSLDGHIGYTSPGGRTKVSVRLGRSRDEGLEFGQRRFVEDARRARFLRNPGPYGTPASPSVNVLSTNNATLVTLPAYGGVSLNASSTYLPVSMLPLAASEAGVLLANAGTFDFALAPDGQGARQSFLTPTRSASAMATLRQSVSDAGELFADYLRFGIDGRATTAAIITNGTFVPAGADGNPFAQAIQISYPTPGLLGVTRGRTTSDRLTVGGILRFGHGWTANVDVSTGRSSTLIEVSGASARPTTASVFLGGEALASQLAAIGVSRLYSSYSSNRLLDANARLAGSLTQLRGGPLSMTLTAEARQERMAGERFRTYGRDGAPTTTTTEPDQRQRVASLFGELRAPIGSGDDKAFWLRGLELQLAVRHDRYAIRVPDRTTRPVTATVTSRAGLTAVTGGLKWKPFDGLTLRASVADGYTPPTPEQLTPFAATIFSYALTDPKRGGAQPFSPDTLVFLAQGSPELRPAHTRTLSAGVIVAPASIPGARLSIDYSELRTTGEVTDFANFDYQYFVRNEADYPGRVTRAALTADDISRGFTGGKITQIDSSYLGVGRSALRAVDVSAEFSFPSPIGALRLYGLGTWLPSLKRRGNPAGSYYDSVGYANGPLAVRGNAGIDWSEGRWTASINTQFYGGYRVTYAYWKDAVTAAAYERVNATALLDQDAARIPAQAYLDLSLGYDLPFRGMRGGTAAATYRLGIKNLLDSSPPPVFTPVAPAFDEVGYSTFGDPRGRRIQLDVSARF